MMPRLQAEEALRTAEVVAVGSGVMKPATARRVVRQWTRESGAGRRPPKASPQVLASMGIKIEVIEGGSGG